jgi:hypothetical protein
MVDGRIPDSCKELVSGVIRRVYFKMEIASGEVTLHDGKRVHWDLSYSGPVLEMTVGEKHLEYRLEDMARECSQKGGTIHNV